MHFQIPLVCTWWYKMNDTLEIRVANIERTTFLNFKFKYWYYLTKFSFSYIHTPR
jgi:hypothetical protein